MWSSRTDWPAGRGPSALRAARRGLTVAPFALAGLVLSSCVSGPVRQVRSNVERIDAGPVQQTSQNNLLTVAAQDYIGPDLEYRVDETFTFNTLRTEVPGVTGTSHDETSLNRPTVELALTQGPLVWTQTYRMQQDRTLFDAGADNELVRKDVLQRLDWGGEDLPQLTAWLNYRTVEDRFFVDQESLEARLQANQQIGPFSYDYTLRDEVVRDLDTDAENSRLEHLLRGTYDDRHLDDRLSTTLGVFVNERDFSNEAATGVSPTVQVTPLQGFSDVDLTPQISTLTNNPGLIDGNVVNATGIDIGGFAGGGQLSWNLGVELPPGSAVDVIELQTAATVPANFVSQFAFSAWASDDNTFWTLVQGSVPFVYDPAQLHFRLSIPAIGNRYLKIVNTASPAAAPQVLITELEVFRRAGAGASNTARTDESIYNSNANVSWRLSDTVTVGYDGFVQTADAETDGVATRDELRLDNGLWTSWLPSERFEANLRVSEQRTEDDILTDQLLRNVLGVLTYRPVQTVDIDLSYNYSDRDLDDRDETQLQALQLLGTAQLLRTLRGELLCERNVTDDFANQREIARWIASAALIAQLTRQFEVTVRARSDQADVTGAGAAGIPDPSEERYETTLLYRPTERFILEWELNWLDNFAGSGLDQRVNVDWIPFEDGAIDLQVDYERIENRSVNDDTYDRWRALTRWTLQPRVYFELQYQTNYPERGPRTEIVTLSFNFTS